MPLLSPTPDPTRIISAGVGPIIVISACGLLCLAFYNRLAAVVGRLRGFHRERMREQEALSRQQASASPDPLAVVRHQEIIGALQVQTTRVNRRARLIRMTLICLLLTIISLALCSLCLGLSVPWPLFNDAAAILFILGLVLLILGVVFALIEVFHSLDPVELEARFVSEMADVEGK